ncbi:MAG TPA: peptidoglycan-binding protein [Candidatus Acidoferrales bacterium]|nr:peptidoglycan-binding protein [Candidatus Acidoferrales bacterium]
MKRLLGLAVMAAMTLLMWGAQTTTTQAKKTPVKKSTAKTASTKAPAKKGATTASVRKKSPAKKSATWRNRQLTPSPERYREIQNALVAKGYLQGEDANGAWNQNSIDALRRFQYEQNLEPSGKINSLSLIALGLGPKRETAAAASPPPASK